MASLCLLIFYFILLLMAIASGVPRSEFKCTSAGYFPDPEDCTHYHVCVHSPTAEHEFVDVLYAACDEGRAYDPRTTACSLDIDDIVCTRDSADCTDGDSQPVEEGSDIYWVCVGGRKVYTACPLGQIFSNTTKQCEDAATIPSPGPAPPIGQKCKEPGIWCDPRNCHRYYTCSRKNVLCQYKCYVGYHYDIERQKCVYGSCDKDWESKCDNIWGI